MKSLLDHIRSRFSSVGGHAKGPSAGDTATVRRIVQELEALPPERARYIACFAYLLSRVANADLEISDQESKAMERIVQEFGDLPADQALLAVEVAKGQSRLFGGTENFQVAREFKHLSTRDQRRELLHCLFAVSAADDDISAEEEAQVRQIAEELNFTHREYVEVRSSYSEKRSVIKRLSRRR